mmetsp:Transcript_61357/g.177995  ORF Transcript_61357/g.177995 Transcript_61357/m.177995 type:complete len:149 (-) Transcript_61357:76-522(-)|eukprot:CAMPEP_0170372318 /NCGR_PEP_ID=MMETSP0117_2-20130122/9489_1 /TAXON_ID=400756 /ORGANISM="Durinskia baltica, Strain CSIRO CS-38" /LENGTH=148 /DNA_ID=CAMNT_0010627169 /DNA_START=65 /DNA_END=511 /DNA_ORIENTATION=-
MFCCCAAKSETAEEVQADAKPSVQAQAPALEGKSGAMSPREVGADKAHDTETPLQTTFRVTIEKEAGAKLGLDVVRFGSHLKVKRIQPGLIEIWNGEHPEEAMRVGDLITSVNGVTGGGDTSTDLKQNPLLNAIKDADKLDMVVVRAI